MLIESIIKREGGTHITLGGEKYSFMPDDQGRHVCEVKNRDHIGTLLAIREGYRLANDEKPVDVPADVVDEVVPDVVQPVGDDVDDTADENGDVNGEEAPADDDREAWVELYVEKFGRKPHHRWSIERIRTEIEAE